MGIIIADKWKDAENVHRLSIIVNGEYWDIYSYNGKIISQQKGRYVIDIEPQGKYFTTIVGSYLPTDEILNYIRLSHGFIGEALAKYDKGLMIRGELADAIHESADWLASMVQELSFTGL